ncbi:hypothetical protein TNCV_1709961 [Trichonephila clavipes]|nr:hypothetical protein TNCV_1709961 [Trichonephila clavipes]
MYSDEEDSEEMVEEFDSSDEYAHENEEHPNTDVISQMEVVPEILSLQQICLQTISDNLERFNEAVTTTTDFHYMLHLHYLRLIGYALCADDLDIWSSNIHKKNNILVNRLNDALEKLSMWCGEKAREHFNILDIPVPPPLDPVIPLAKGRTDLTQVVRKKKISDSVLKAITLETINTRYPQPDWLQFYTDES